MRQCRATEHENSQAVRMFLPLLGERAGVRASVSLNLIFGVVGSNSLEITKSFRADSFRLLTSLTGSGLSRVEPRQDCPRLAQIFFCKGGRTAEPLSG